MHTTEPSPPPVVNGAVPPSTAIALPAPAAAPDQPGFGDRLGTWLLGSPLRNFEEKLIFFNVAGMYLTYFAGVNYIVAPLLAYMLLGCLIRRLWLQTDETPPEDRVCLPLGIWIWLLGILIIGVAVVIGHITWDYGVARIIRSFINFYLRSYFLMAIYPLAGCLPIRPQILYRAAAILGIHHLILSPIGIAMGNSGMKMPLYINTIAAKIGGLGDRFYSVSLYVMEDGAPRLMLFADWAPGLALGASVLLYMSVRERSWPLKLIALVGHTMAVLGSESRMGQMALIVVPCAVFGLSNLLRPLAQMMVAIASVLGGLFGAQLLQAAKDFKNNFSSQRAASSRVRAALQRIAAYRWRTDAPIWGHSMIQPEGPQVTQKMPIGSHHTWFGVLYVNGLVGGVGLALTLASGGLILILKSQTRYVARAALSVWLVMILFSFGENLEGLVYLYWPGLILIGCGLKEPWGKWMDVMTANWRSLNAAVD